MRYRGTALAFMLLVTAGVALAIALVSQERALRTGSARAADRFDLIVTAPGSQTDALLAAVFLQPGAARLIGPQATARLLNETRGTSFVAPLAFGDSYRGAPVVGTTGALVERLSEGGLAEGRSFANRREAVVGAASPLHLGATFSPVHGAADHQADDEDAPGHGAELVVVGRMRPTGSPWDRAITVPVELVWQVHSLPDGHPVDSPEAVGPPFDPLRTPGISAAVVRPDSIADAYRLRSLYATTETMAFFPAEALRTLYALLGDVRRLMSLLAVATQALVLLAIIAGVLILFRLLAPVFVTLRAIGAPRAYLFAIAWGFTASLMLAGTVLGLGGGYALSFAVSQWLAHQTGLALVPALGWAEFEMAAAVLATGFALAMVPAWLLQRRPLARALTEV